MLKRWKSMMRREPGHCCNFTISPLTLMEKEKTTSPPQLPCVKY